MTGYSGADLAALVREACMQALREAERNYLQSLGNSSDIHNTNWAELPVLRVVVKEEHFDYALSKIRPSVSQQSEREYDRMAQRLSNARSQLTPAPQTSG